MTANSNSNQKVKAAVFKFTCCAGCQFALLHFFDQQVETLELLDFVYFKMARRKELDEPYELAFIEGGVSAPEHIEQLKAIRKQAKTLVAFGACAAHGGVPAIKDWQTEIDVEERAYPDPLLVSSMKVSPVDEFVKVDHYLRGCPIDEVEFMEMIRSIAADKRPYVREHPVCLECKLKNNICILLMREGVQESMCLGPVTRGGCRVVCTSNMRACFGCRGPMSNPNIAEMVRTFKGKGFSGKDIEMRFTEYAGLSAEFREGARAYYERKAPYYKRKAA
ncbi:MAG: oxidoreductase [Actinobacteria bacterium]|nr:oxidoreductase [Actinomycetota bacterium]